MDTFGASTPCSLHHSASECCAARGTTAEARLGDILVIAGGARERRAPPRGLGCMLFLPERRLSMFLWTRKWR